MPNSRYREPRPFYRSLGLSENMFFGLLFWGGGGLLLVGGGALAGLGTGGLAVGGGIVLALVGLLMALFWTYVYLLGRGSQR